MFGISLSLIVLSVDQSELALFHFSLYDVRVISPILYATRLFDLMRWDRLLNNPYKRKRKKYNQIINGFLNQIDYYHSRQAITNTLLIIINIAFWKKKKVISAFLCVWNVYDYWLFENRIVKVESISLNNTQDDNRVKFRDAKSTHFYFYIVRLFI